MGTTLTAMLWDGLQFACAHIGDSRAYLLREGMLYQLTHDHTLVQALLDDGRITAEQAAVHPRRSMLSRALDGGESVTCDLWSAWAEPGDRYLLCTDGLSGVVRAERLVQVLATVKERPQEFAAAVQDDLPTCRCARPPRSLSSWRLAADKGRK